MSDFMKSFLDKLAAMCREHNMFPAGTGKALVAVSGGPDSMCLLHSLNTLAEELDITLAVAHLNHGTRGADSDRDEEFVEKTAAAMGLDYTAGRIGRDVPPPAGPGSPEALLREARYSFLHDAAASCGASRIALGHNMDDQAETVLMRMIRGTSATGMAGIRPVHGSLVRPLLFTSRADITRYCEENSLEYMTDATNADQDFTRNRLRHSLIPLLEKEYNPQVRERLAGLAALLREDADFLDELAGIAAGLLLREETGKRLVFVMKGMRRLPGPILKRVLISAAQRLAGPDAPRIGSSHIDSLVAAVRTSPAGISLDLPGNVTVEKKYETLEFARGAASGPAPPDPGTVTIENPSGTVPLEGFGAELVFEHLEYSGQQVEDPGPGTALLDEDTLDGTLEVRPWRDGDIFHPLGMEDQKKLSDFFIDGKIDRDARRRVPILTCGGRIAWVAGMRIDHCFRIVPGRTRRVMKITFKKPGQK